MSSGETWTIPLWEGRWNKTALIKRQGEIGERAFNRGFRQMALSDKERTFPAFDQCLVRGLDIFSVIDAEWPRYVGVDPSSDARPGSCIFVLCRSGDGKKHVLHVEFGAWKPDQLAERVIAINNEYLPSAIYFENNALQDAYISLIKLRGGHDIPIRGFMTGKQKSDPLVGLPSLEIEFENKAWIIPDPEHEINCGCGLHRWFKEMRNHPLYETADGIMACWFAREASKLGGGTAATAIDLKRNSKWHPTGTPSTSVGYKSRWRRS